MKITRENYEIYFIDYFDGNLSIEDKNILLNFLSINTDLESEFYEFEKITLPIDNSLTIENSLLKKTTKLEKHSNITEFEYLCVGHWEKDLSVDEESKLTAILDTNPSLNKEFLKFKNLKLKTDKNIKFTNKKQLKVFEINYKQIMQIAAIGLILVVSIVLLNHEKTELHTLNKIADISSIKDIQEQYQKNISTPNKEFETIKITKTKNNSTIVKKPHKNFTKQQKEKTVLSSNNKISPIELLDKISIKKASGNLAYVSSEIKMQKTYNKYKVENYISKKNEKILLSKKEYAKHLFRKVLNIEKDENVFNILSNRIRKKTNGRIKIEKYQDPETGNTVLAFNTPKIHLKKTFNRN